MTRWMSRYAGGRLRLRLSWYASLRGWATRAASPRSHDRVNWKSSATIGSSIGRMNSSTASASISDVRADEPLGPQAGQHLVGPALDGQPGQPADRLRVPVGQPGDGTEVEHAEPSVVEQPEVARVRVGVQQAGPARRGEVQRGQPQPAQVALVLRYPTR